MLTVRWALILALSIVLAACAPAPPVAVPGPTEVPDAQVRSQAQTFQVLLTELYEHFLVAGPGAAQYISAEATPVQAAAELRAAVGLGDQASRFALATGTELARTAAASTPAARTREIQMEIRDVQVLGELDGTVVVATTVWQQHTAGQGPITEQTVTYAVGWRGEELASVSEVVSTGGVQGLDAGTGLSSPLGAVRRFVELVEEHDLEAIAHLSGGANTDEIALEVLASVIDSSEHTYVVALPQSAEGAVHVVYLVNTAGMVVGRFEVTIGQATEVVYFATV